jgi:hypothetical protein
MPLAGVLCLGSDIGRLLGVELRPSTIKPLR